MSQTRARQVVIRLTEHGMLSVEVTSASHLVRLNREHLATEPAVALATLRARLLDNLRDLVGSWSPPAIHVSMFGSAARGDGATGADVDLLVVHDEFRSLSDRDAWDDQLARTDKAVHGWTGNWVGWFQIGEHDLSRMAAAREPIVGEWKRDAIALFGPPLPTFLRGKV